MKNSDMLRIVVLLLAGLFAGVGARAQIVIVEGERFTPKDKNGWSVTHMDDSYASMTFGGMWLSQGGCLGAPAESKDSVAMQTVSVPATGEYRVWSKYQAPPYFNYLHKIEILQNGKTVFSQVYGKSGADRLWSFGGVGDELWWFWGIDHDAAEGSKAPARLAAGPAEIRLITVANEEPAGDRFIDFVVLTTNLADTYQGFKPYAVGTPFANEALDATKLYLRFKNTGGAAAKLTLSRGGHFQPNYGGANLAVPDADVATGAWSPWVNIGSFCRLVHDEGVGLSLSGGGIIPVQIARDAEGKDIVGDLTVQDKEAIVIPVDITWNKGRKVLASREHAQALVQLCRKGWRTANGGKKPQSLLYFGAFRSSAGWIAELKDALGYNTGLPDNYTHVACDGYHAHAHTPTEINAFVPTIPDKSKFRVLSFGDEIGVSDIDWNDPAMQAAFVPWLKSKGLTKTDLGVEPAAAKLADRGASRRIAWYAQAFSEEQRFAGFRAMTAQAKALIGPQVETGANYSPHGAPQYYGPIYQWIDVFKYNGMTMFWGEDYVFCVPQLPQIFGWMMATIRCAVKYNHQKIHVYVMPHAPGQVAEYLRRNMVYAVGAGADSIDSFWVAPAESFTENFIAWNYTNSFRAIHEAIFDAAEAEPYLFGGTPRPARIAVVLSKATDFNERRTLIPKADDIFTRRCKNADASIQQIICRVEAQMAFICAKRAGHNVDLITEEDILNGRLKGYDVVCFAGEWVEHRVPAKLEVWVKEGGILYASAGCGRLNEFGEPEQGLLNLLGLKEAGAIKKNLASLRPLLELPLADPIDTIIMGNDKIAAIGMRQVLTPGDEAKVLATWSDGKAAATVRELGKGKAFAVGTLSATSCMKTALPVRPLARGGNKAPVVPGAFAPAAARLALLGIAAGPLVEEVACSVPAVEGLVIDTAKGSVITLVNWTDKPIAGLQVVVRMPASPIKVRSVQNAKDLKVTYANGAATFTTDLEWADYIVIPK